MPVLLLLAATALSGGPAPATAHADDSEIEPGEAVVEKLVLRLRKKADRCVLRVRLPLDGVFEVFDPQTDVVAVDIGSQRVFELPTPDARRTLRERQPLLWKYRKGRRGPRLALDLAFRTVKVTVPGLDLDAVADGAPDHGLRIAVTLGDRVFEDVVDVGGTPRKMVLAPPTPVFGQPGGGDPRGGDPGGGDPGGGAVTVNARVLALAGQSGIASPTNAVARTAAEWTTLWNQHQAWMSPPGALPSVDFSTEMVVAVCFGDRPSPAHSIELRSVVSDGTTTTVRTTDARITSGTCLFAAVIVQPCVFVAVPRTDSRHPDIRPRSRLKS